MADQIFNVLCGFFDAVDGDRLYTAEDMNRPYKRLVSNGVFATQFGTPSTDLQVLSSGSGMVINVNAGQGLFADKWFDNPAAIAITVPGNTSGFPRIDSVVIRVDQRTSGRVGSIVYRTGTPASNPAPPPLDGSSGITEYRLANVRVADRATLISNSVITDLRGSEECPWVTGLITQVDTRELFRQYQAAYEEYYRISTAEFAEYTAEQRAIWEAFLETLTTELTVTTNIAMFTDEHVLERGQVTVPIDIASFNASTDILMVFADGLKKTEGIDYTINTQTRLSITLRNVLPSGTIISFTVFKSLAVTEIETVIAALQQLDAKISAITADSGWINISLLNGATPVPGDVPSVRKVGDTVYLRGSFMGLSSGSTIVGRLPSGYRPSAPQTYGTVAVPDSFPATTVPLVLQIDAGGNIQLNGVPSTYAASARVPITTEFILG